MPGLRHSVRLSLVSLPHSVHGRSSGGSSYSVVILNPIPGNSVEAKGPSKRNHPMNTKMYVGNLSFDTTEPELREIFAEFEPILELTRPFDRNTGKPRGFAFVDMPEGAARQAIDHLNGSEYGGRDLTVRFANPRS